MKLIRTAADWNRLDLHSLARPAPATGVLLCPPTHFDILEVHNVHMEGRVSSVDPNRAAQQWNQLADEIAQLGLRVEHLEPQEERADMVFTANPSLPGVDREGRRFAILSRMRHASRQPEVEAHENWLRSSNTPLVRISDGVTGTFEGGGDGVWHPDHFVLWGGVGPRSDVACYEDLSQQLDLPIALLDLRDPSFYHLDTCLATLGSGRAAAVRAAFDEQGWALLGTAFADVVEVDEAEARACLAGNLYCPDGVNVLLPAGAKVTRKRLEAIGLRVKELDTGEFLKSGGSIYCMRQQLYD